MAANKTKKPSATSKAPVKGKTEVTKKVAAKAKSAGKMPVKTKDVLKDHKKMPPAATHGKPGKSTPVTVVASKPASKIDPNSKKSIVSVAVKKIIEQKAAAKAKATAPAVKPSAEKAGHLAKAPAATAKPVVATGKAAPVAKAPPVKAAPVVAKTQPAAPKPAPQKAGVAAAKAAAAPSVVLPLKKLPLNGKPVAPVAAKPGAAVAPAAHKPAQPLAKAPVAAASQPDPKKAPAKPANQRHGFRTNEYIVYPSHGVGKIVRIEEQVVAGYSLELFVIHFEQEKMTLRVPTAKLASVGMRKLAESGIVDRAMETLKGRARIKRTMWSRRAQEYEAKINSGDLVAIAEVVRDLFRAETQPEQSYSERQLFEQALDRMSREIAAIENLDDRGATQKVIEVLSKSAKSRKAVEAAAATEPAVDAGGAERAA